MGIRVLAKKNIVWSNHAKFLKWVSATYMMCVIDESGSVELAQGCKSDGKGGFINCSAIQTSCSSVFDGGFNQHTNNIWKYWYFQVGARNPFGAMGVNGNMPIGNGDSENWCKTRMSRCAGYNDYYKQLDQQLSSLGGQRAGQEQIAQNTYQQGLNTATGQYTQGQQNLDTSRQKTLRDLSSNLAQSWQQGNIALGTRGASDSSAANQYSYALTKMGNRNRGDIQGSI